MSVAWMDHAACRGKDSNLWFADQTHEGAQRAQAIRICRSCPVTQQCLKHFLTLEGGRSRYGRHTIVAGLTPAQRAGLGAVA